MITLAKEKVEEVSNRVKPLYAQIVIDLFQDRVDDLLDEENVTPEDIGALSYEVDLLIEVFNPELTTDLILLKELKLALDEWYADAYFVNKSLGLDPNK